MIFSSRSGLTLKKLTGQQIFGWLTSDKESYYVNLSFSTAELNKRDPATDIVVTATLDGKPLPRKPEFCLDY